MDPMAWDIEPLLLYYLYILACELQRQNPKRFPYKYRMTLDSGHSKYCIVIIPEGQATFYHGLRKGAMCAIWPTFYSHPILN